ncbi:MAG: dihydroxyacetone kinase family protein [Faecousia sp.]
MQVLDAHTLPELFDRVAVKMADHAEELCEMDAKMGDGDLGLTMRRGFAAIPEFLRRTDEPDLGRKLMKAGMHMASVAPSTMGTLMASGIMSAGKALTGATNIDAKAYLTFLQAFSDGISKRGKCVRGEKTVLDCTAAAADAVEEALKANPLLSLSAAAQAAVSGGSTGVEATKTMEAKYGKAAVHRAASVGVADQGACAALYMLEGIHDFLGDDK